MSKREYKEMVVPCKVCGKEFKLHLPMGIYEMYMAAAEGEPVEFTGTCPRCRRAVVRRGILRRLLKGHESPGQFSINLKGEKQ
jgi:hypothetical protein